MAPQRSIPFTALLGDLEPAHCKAHFATPNAEGHRPIDALTNDPDGAWLFWNRWRPSRDEFNREFIVSFAQMPQAPKEWLFGGVFRVTGRRPEPRAHSYDVERVDDLRVSGFERRLQVHYGGLKRLTRLNLEGALPGMSISQVLPQPYAGLEFPGLDRIELTLEQLAVLHEQQRPDWRYALETLRGIYVIRDHETGGLYVGSASGDQGVWSRWGAYAASVHGNNKALRELVGELHPAAAASRFSIALLEHFAARTDENEILQRESFWKRVLGSRDGRGLNRN